MEINPLAIKIKDLVEGFADNGEEGVTGYGGRLNIRPKYQREFVYDAKKQAAVISSVFRNFPLNVMYWAKNGDGTFELLDGQQRTLSICAYREGSFFIKIDGTPKGYGNLTEEQRDRFLGYRLQIYVCENGTDTEKAHWFETINIAGEKLTPQELDNALYPGPWVTEMIENIQQVGLRGVQSGKQVPHRLPDKAGLLPYRRRVDMRRQVGR